MKSQLVCHGGRVWTGLRVCGMVNGGMGGLEEKLVMLCTNSYT